MEKYKIFIAADAGGGLNLLINSVESLVKYQRQVEPCSHEVGQHVEWYSILLPPTYMSCYDDTKMPCGFYEWTSKCDAISNNNLLFGLKKISEMHMVSSECVTMTEDDAEFIGESLHQLADKLPKPGSCILEVYFYTCKEYFPKPYIFLIASLKRLEVSHQAFFGLISGGDPEDIWEVYADWITYINFNFITPQDLLFHCKASPIWTGTIKLMSEKNSVEIYLKNYFLYSSNQYQNLTDFCMHTTATSENQKQENIVFDNKIEIVALVSHEYIPIHLVNPAKFYLCSFTSWKHQTFNFFDVCRYKENIWCLGILKYDLLHEAHEIFTADWISYISDPFTHYLSPATSSQQTLHKHLTLLIQLDKQTDSILVYFFQNAEDINVAGLLKLLKNEKLDVSDNVLVHDDNTSMNSMNEHKDAAKFYENAAEFFESWEWCEKNLWVLEESLCKSIKSIARCKSDDFYMQGVMIPTAESVGDRRHQKSLGDILALFNKSGHHVNCSIQPIPVIEDRLLKNMKSENSVMNLQYDEAKNVIGHGIDYCIDSLGAVRLSERLLKVQNVLIPNDTINFNSSNLEVIEDLTVANTKRKMPVKKECVLSIQCSDKRINKKKESCAEKKESRAERHRRRLKTIVEGTVIKYGHISKEHNCYKLCCDKLFEICISLVRNLKSSKDLNEQMKQFAKTHVNEIVKCFIDNHVE